MSGKRRSKQPVLLSELTEAYIKSPRRGLKKNSADQLRYSVKGFGRWLREVPTTKHLNAETVNQFVEWRQTNHSSQTVKRSRMHLILLWRFAARQKLVATKPDVDDVPTVTVKRKNPTAWTLPELEKLLAACRLLHGNMPALDQIPKNGRPPNYHFFRGPHRWQWWSSLVLFLYDTGARLSAAMAVTPADIDLERGVVVLRGDAAKTGIEQVLRLSRQTVDAIRLHFDPKLPTVWHWGFAWRALFEHFTKIIKSAGLPADHTRKFHCLRRTCATLTAAAGYREVAQSTLGHTSGEMTARYIDQRAAPTKCAADVLPRPQIKGESVTDDQASQNVPAASDQPNGHDVADVLANLSADELATLMKLAKALTPKNGEMRQ